MRCVVTYPLETTGGKAPSLQDLPGNKAEHPTSTSVKILQSSVNPPMAFPPALPGLHRTDSLPSMTTSFGGSLPGVCCSGCGCLPTRSAAWCLLGVPCTADRVCGLITQLQILQPSYCDSLLTGYPCPASPKLSTATNTKTNLLSTWNALF